MISRSGEVYLPLGGFTRPAVKLDGKTIPAPRQAKERWYSPEFTISRLPRADDAHTHWLVPWLIDLLPEGALTRSALRPLFHLGL